MQIYHQLSDFSKGGIFANGFNFGKGRRKQTQFMPKEPEPIFNVHIIKHISRKKRKSNLTAGILNLLATEGISLEYMIMNQSIQQSTYCQYYKREKLCRKIVSKYLDSPFNIRQPDFLKTSEYLRGLQLDIYYPEYGFAIEVQGEQYEKYIKFFHRDPYIVIPEHLQELGLIK
ncbi:hypothetical protein Glove_103g5 [Diversispora epigaea]|uniref:Uncharacterized protein n=1 Tax=Diversispora epigaea TaxID=1348612 RepID=A0A397JCZ5_9GLOM|nr:hypothetical protein Glove_103g5 [Diversispora epigaea]